MFVCIVNRPRAVARLLLFKWGTDGPVMERNVGLMQDDSAGRTGGGERVRE